MAQPDPTNPWGTDFSQPTPAQRAWAAAGDSQAYGNQSFAQQGFAGVGAAPAPAPAPASMPMFNPTAPSRVPVGTGGYDQSGAMTAPGGIYGGGLGPTGIRTMFSGLPPSMNDPRLGGVTMAFSGGAIPAIPQPAIFQTDNNPAGRPSTPGAGLPIGSNPSARGGAGAPIGQPGFGGSTAWPYPGGSAPNIGQPQGFSWPSMTGAGQAGNENRSFSMNGLDPRLDAMFSYGAQQALARYQDPNGMSFYGGPTVAGLTPDEMQAQTMLRNLAYNGAGGLADAGSGYYTGTLDRAMHPQNDPTLQAAIDGMTQDTMRAATDPGGIYQQIRQGAVQNGTMGSSRQGIAEGIASGRVADSIANQSAQMRLAGRGQNMQAAGQAFGNTGQAITAATAPGTILGGIGAQNRAIDQANMDANLRAWAYNTYEPDRRLQNLYNLMGATPFGGYQAGQSFVGNDILRGPSGGTSTGQNIAGGIAGGIGLYQILRNAGLF